MSLLFLSPLTKEADSFRSLAKGTRPWICAALLTPHGPKHHSELPQQRGLPRQGEWRGAFDTIQREMGIMICTYGFCCVLPFGVKIREPDANFT